MVSPAATSPKRLTSGETVIVSVRPVSSLSVSLREGKSTASTVAVSFVTVTTAASPGTPVAVTSTGSGPAGFDDAQAARRNAEVAIKEKRMFNPTASAEEAHDL